MRLVRTGALALTLVMAAGTAMAQEAPEAADPPQAPAAPMWLVSCSNQMQPDTLVCEVSQSIVLTDDAGRSQRIATAAFLRAAGSTETTAVFTFPYEIDLTRAPVLSVDGADLGSLAWQSCDAQGCYASGPVAEDWLDVLRSGEALVAHLRARNGQDYDFNFQLQDLAPAMTVLP
ncbi:MAG: invasion associated locus B family protein [Rubellimicrobium sp.]|nr:invasion associated locus B family protein [Rubellimicrobium sp.]